MLLSLCLESRGTVILAESCINWKVLSLSLIFILLLHGTFISFHLIHLGRAAFQERFIFKGPSKKTDFKGFVQGYICTEQKNLKIAH